MLDTEKVIKIYYKNTVQCLEDYFNVKLTFSQKFALFFVDLYTKYKRRLRIFETNYFYKHYNYPNYEVTMFHLANLRRCNGNKSLIPLIIKDKLSYLFGKNNSVKPGKYRKIK